MKAARGLRMGGALGALFATVVLAGAANPTTASAATYLIQSKEDTRLCLQDSFSSGVRLGACDSSAYWDIWIGGWTRNRATGRCLRATTRIIQTAGCSTTDGYSFWRNWNGGWYQRIGSSTIGPPMCLSRLPGYPYAVTIKACVDPTGWHHPRELWWVFPR
jgi:hypothetical protein